MGLIYPWFLEYYVLILLLLSFLDSIRLPRCYVCVRGLVLNVCFYSFNLWFCFDPECICMLRLLGYQNIIRDRRAQLHYRRVCRCRWSQSTMFCLLYYMIDLILLWAFLILFVVIHFILIFIHVHIFVLFRYC